MAARRKHMPMRVKLDAVLHILGLLGMEIEWHHCPALGLREYDPETGLYTPDENDPRYIVPLIKAVHRRITNGTPATSADGDIHKIAKAKRLSADQERFRARLLEKPPREERPRTKWPKRKLRSGAKFKQGRAS